MKTPNANCIPESATGKQKLSKMSTNINCTQVNFWKWWRRFSDVKGI
jgi:hypothetical protein